MKTLTTFLCLLVAFDAKCYLEDNKDNIISTRIEGTWIRDDDMSPKLLGRQYSNLKQLNITRDDTVLERFEDCDYDDGVDGDDDDCADQKYYMAGTVKMNTPKGSFDLGG